MEAEDKRKKNSIRSSKLRVLNDPIFNEFHAWECLSLVTRKGTTLDFVIHDMSYMMALLSVFARHIYQPED